MGSAATIATVATVDCPHGCDGLPCQHFCHLIVYVPPSSRLMAPLPLPPPRAPRPRSLPMMPRSPTPRCSTSTSCCARTLATCRWPRGCSGWPRRRAQSQSSGTKTVRCQRLFSFCVCLSAVHLLCPGPSTGLLPLRSGRRGQTSTKPASLTHWPVCCCNRVRAERVWVPGCLPSVRTQAAPFLLPDVSLPRG